MILVLLHRAWVLVYMTSIARLWSGGGTGRQVKYLGRHKPIMRPQLRVEAWTKIGDTGLLDHLLKHMAGKLALGGIETFGRLHNADGAMDYWLESADLVNIRKDTRVSNRPIWGATTWLEFGSLVNLQLRTQLVLEI
ncbi:unnamed protein product [Fraxinus pennsylvanica]|uniref:PTC1-like winged helix-turn-helix domain-containing protein n=1 Tax=Fraxinus pennsylvanica TaxID=56036 RepID=A0AAD1ZL40_9LAMI|nr:unnamed protein product [Fraxinus pennsylvanica]